MCGVNMSDSPPIFVLIRLLICHGTFFQYQGVTLSTSLAALSSCRVYRPGGPATHGLVPQPTVMSTRAFVRVGVFLTYL